MNKKQKYEQFADMYLQNNSANFSHSLIYGETKNIGNKYYVYALVAQDTDQIIYIGKGKDKRAYSHLTDAKNGRISNAPKHKVITEILGRGYSVMPLIIETNLKERAAYKIEKHLISNLKHSITNIANGCQHNLDKLEQQALYYIKKTKPFDVWIQTMPKRMWIEVCKSDIVIAKKWYDDFTNTMQQLLERVRENNLCRN